MKLDNAFKNIAIIKNLTNRTFGYLAIMNAFAIILTFKKVYSIQTNSIYIIIFGIIGIFVLGYIDYKFILKHEITHTNHKNNISHKLDSIIKKLDNKK